jgi:glycosyltransferase involved in cell wall biosynthesis
MKRITFITTGQPTTNPRLVKEAKTLINLGYHVRVICCFYQSWAGPLDQKIIDKHPGTYIFCGGGPAKNRTLYFYTRLRQKACAMLFKYNARFGIAENAISRTHADALSIAKSIKTDLYIAHNLGALPAAVIAAQSNGAKVGYDAEDIHSGQFSAKIDPAYRLNKYIEEKYFDRTDYFTAASPLIAENYKKLYPYLKPVVINNVFLKTNNRIFEKNKPGEPLKLFWFSQTIGPARGIETIFAAMSITTAPVQLHLLGNDDANARSFIDKLTAENKLNQNQVQLHKPVAPDELFDFAAQFDIGLATETGETLNRDICLTNKIFTYLQCGLALIASDTQAQTLFLNQHSACGLIYKKNDPKSLANCINDYVKDPVLLYQTRVSNHQLGQVQLNWENESLEFIALVKKTLELA